MLRRDPTRQLNGRRGGGWSESSQSHQRVEHDHDSRGTSNQGSLCWRGANSNLAISHSFIHSVSQSGEEPVTEFRERANERLVSIQVWDFLDKLTDF
jgi:hypothetical protein